MRVVALCNKLSRSRGSRLDEEGFSVSVPGSPVVSNMAMGKEASTVSVIVYRTRMHHTGRITVYRIFNKFTDLSNVLVVTRMPLQYVYNCGTVVAYCKLYRYL